MKRNLLLFILPLFLLACGGGMEKYSLDTPEEAMYDDEMAFVEAEEGIARISETSDMADMRERATGRAQPEQEVKATAPTEKKKIIKEGRMGIETKDIAAMKSRVDAAVARYGGYYGQENYDDGDYRASYVLSMRVPSQNFEKFVEEIGAGGGKVLYKQIDAHDVTETFVDLETRMATKRRSLERYRELVRRANTIREVMEVEYEIRRLEEEIESVEGRLRFMGDRVSYSTLELTITHDKGYRFSPDKRDSFWERFKESLSEGWDGVVFFVIGFMKVWPLWIVIGVVVWLLRRAYLSAKRKEKDKNPI